MGQAGRRQQAQTVRFHYLKAANNIGVATDLGRQTFRQDRGPWTFRLQSWSSRQAGPGDQGMERGYRGHEGWREGHARDHAVSSLTPLLLDNIQKANFRYHSDYGYGEG